MGTADQLVSGGQAGDAGAEGRSTGDGMPMEQGAGAARTVILTVDDDPGVSRAVARDLRRHYGELYRIVRAESGESALAALVSGAQLTDRARRQALKFGAELLTAREVTGLAVNGASRVVRFPDGSAVAAHSVILATGVAYRQLDAPTRPS